MGYAFNSTFWELWLTNAGRGGGAGGKLWHTPLSFQPKRCKKSRQPSLPGRRVKTCAPRRGGRGKSLPPDARGRCSPHRRVRGARIQRPHLGRGQGARWGSRTRGLASQQRRAPSAQPRTGAQAVDKALGSGATRGPSWPDSGDEGVPRAGRRGTDLDGAGVLAVVQQPHGAAVLALQAPAAAAHQPAQHLPAHPPPGETRRRCGPRTRRPSARQLRTGPKHLHHHPSADAAAASCWPSSSSFSSSFSATASPQPRTSARLSSLRALLPVSCSWGGASAGGAQWGSARRNRVADSRASRNRALRWWTSWGSNHGKAVGPR